MTITAVKMVAVRDGQPQQRYVPALALLGPSETVCLPLRPPLRVIVRRPEFFDESPDPPSEWSVDRAINWLQAIRYEGATNQAELLVRLLAVGAHHYHDVLNLAAFQDEE